MKSDSDFFLQNEAPAVLTRLDVCRRIMHLLLERQESGAREPSIRISMAGCAEIAAPTTQPFSVPVILSALVDIRKMCCFFGFSVDAKLALVPYDARHGDFDIGALGIAKPTKAQFLDVLSSENVSAADLEKAYVGALTYVNKALAHYKVGRLQETPFQNHIILSSFGIDRAIRVLVYQALELPDPQLRINVQST